jgi:hypothetical protein
MSDEANALCVRLQMILANDNVQRKVAEAELNEAKKSDPNKYAMLMTLIITPEFQSPLEVKSLAAVILRRNISTTSIDTGDVVDITQNINLWVRLTDETRAQVKLAILNSIRNCLGWPKGFIHKVCSLAVEIQGSMQENENDTIWQDLINLVNELIMSEQEKYVDAALQLFNGLFGYIMSHLIQYKSDLYNVLAKCLQH